MKLEPAHSIIEALGGVSATSRIARRSRARVSNWRLPKSSGGTGGFIPLNCLRPIVQALEAKGIQKTIYDFLPPDELTETEDAA